MIEGLYVIYRPIGSNDEASTDEEQGEKVLFSYPVGQSLHQQLTRITMLEGLIDFTGRFSKQDIDTVVMDKRTWSFLQPEVGLWFIACLSPVQSSLTTKENVKMSGSGLVDALDKMYATFTSFRGNIVKIIDTGLAVIEEAQSVRKKIRKINQRLKQEQLDRESIRLDFTPSIRNEERVGIRADNTLTLEQLQKAVDASNAEIDYFKEKLRTLLEAPTYPMTMLRRTLGSFCRWYIDSGELSMPCGLHAMKGMHYCSWAPCIPGSNQNTPGDRRCFKGIMQESGDIARWTSGVERL